MIAVLAFVCARPFLLLCFNPEQARGRRLPVEALPPDHAAAVAATVIVSFQTVGTLLVFGMLLAPAGAGRSSPAASAR